MRLKSKLSSLNADKVSKAKIYSPANTEELRIPFKTDKTAKVVGKLAQISAPASVNTDEAQMISGILVQNDFKMSLMAPEDLREYAGLTTTTILCKQRLTLSAAGVDLIKWALEGTFGAVEEIGPKKKPTANGGPKVNGIDAEHDDEMVDLEIDRRRPLAYLVMGCIIVRYQMDGEVRIEWEGNMLNDGIADAVMAVLLTVESSPAAVKSKKVPGTAPLMFTDNGLESSRAHHHHEKRNPHAYITPEERLSRLCMFLEAQFGSCITPIAKPKLLFGASMTPKRAAEINGVKIEPSEDTDGGDEDLSDFEAEELERLHSLGIPVPGLEIKVDKNVAKVWLETLEVECTYGVLRDRVKAVVERAVETVAPLWGSRKHGSS